ncbi:hypothetical protein ACFW6S_31370, partial [Streptomyces sp. NPDC058740]|uniref:hypothetical protein n=1 Tax=Streptomyces sp. NPDC058740 TaxID=3346619 RepID=UPI0036BB756C
MEQPHVTPPSLQEQLDAAFDVSLSQLKGLSDPLERAKAAHALVDRVMEQLGDAPPTEQLDAAFDVSLSQLKGLSDPLERAKAAHALVGR